MKDARPGVAETFGEREIDTAQRGYRSPRSSGALSMLGRAPHAR